MNESLIKYLSGLLDADGCLKFNFTRDHSKSDSTFVGLAMSLWSSDAVDKGGFVESLPVLTGMGSTGRAGASKQFAFWQVAKRSDLEMLLPRLVKHMVIKASHWEWMLDTWRDVRSRPIGSRGISSQERTALSEACKHSRKLRVGPLRLKNHPTWAWLAGYLDGDGCYHFKPGGMIRVSAVAHENDRCVLEFLENSFGGTIASHSQSENVLIWYRGLGPANASFALRFLPNLAKHSRLKRHKIDAMIHHHRQRLSVPGVKAQAIV